MTRERLKTTAIAAVIVLVASALSMLATNYLSFVAGMENIARDIRLKHAPPRPQHPDIIIAAINEDTLARFPYRSPVDRAFLARLLTTLEAKGARAIALDVLLDQPTEPEKDRLLYQTIRELKVPLAISYTHTPTVVNEDQIEYLNEFVPPPMRAFANLATDPFDGTVRWMIPGEDDVRTPPAFPRKVAQLVGVNTERKQLDIAWRARPDAATTAFAQYPAHAIGVLPDEWIKNRIVLIGAVLSLTDRHRTPYAVIDDGYDGRMPGILVQAHSTAQLLEGAASARPTLLLELFVTGTFALIGVAIGLMKRGLVVSLSSGIVLLVLWWVGAIIGHEHGLALVPLVAPTLSLAVSLWMMDAIIGSAERRARQFVQTAFSRYVSPAVVEQLIDNPQALSISGRRRDATFIFTDIADFTTLSEGLDAETLSALLNAYLDGACRIILSHGGTIDKFIGDAIMAIFNAPIEQPDHIARARACALELDQHAERFRAEQAARGITVGVTRIGIHTGLATVGNFGSQQRMDFTALGDTVNTASRVEGANKYFGTRLCCTEAVVAGCPGMAFRPIGRVLLKGKRETVSLFEPLSAEQASDAVVIAWREAFSSIEGGGEDAKRIIEKLYGDHPEDPLIGFYRQRMEQGKLGQTIVLDEK